MLLSFLMYLSSSETLISTCFVSPAPCSLRGASAVFAGDPPGPILRSQDIPWGFSPRSARERTRSRSEIGHAPSHAAPPCPRSLAPLRQVLSLGVPFVASGRYIIPPPARGSSPPRAVRFLRPQPATPIARDAPPSRVANRQPLRPQSTRTNVSCRRPPGEPNFEPSALPRARRIPRL